MKKIFAFVLTSSLALGSLLAFAQDGPPPGGAPGAPGGGPGGNSAQFQQMRKLREKYQPWFDLMSTVRMMIDVDKQPQLAFSKTQAKVGLPVLKDLGNRADLKIAEATKILDTLESKVISAAQLKWMDAEQLKRDEERRKRMQEAQQNGGQVRMPGIPGGGQGQGQGNRQGGPGGPGGGGRAMFEAMQSGKAFNPFKQGPGADNLKELMTLLSKK